MPSSSKISMKALRARWGGLLATAAPVAIACWSRWLRHRDDLSDQVMNRCFGLFAVLFTIAAGVFLITAVNWSRRLVLTEEGFTIRSLVSKRSYCWSDGYEFNISTEGGIRYIAFHKPNGAEAGAVVHTVQGDNAEILLRALKKREKTRAIGA
jgi:polyferredoxin